MSHLDLFDPPQVPSVVTSTASPSGGSVGGGVLFLSLLLAHLPDWQLPIPQISGLSIALELLPLDNIVVWQGLEANAGSRRETNDSSPSNFIAIVERVESSQRNTFVASERYMAKMTREI